MANPPVVNTPSSDLLSSFIDRALMQPDAQHPALLPMQPVLRHSQAEMGALIGSIDQSDGLKHARAKAGGADAVHDHWHQFVHDSLRALSRHPEAAISLAATAVLGAIYPDGLGRVIQASYEAQAARGLTLSRRLAHPQVKTAIATLTPEMPRLPEYLQTLLTASQDLGEALVALDAFHVDKAGKAYNPRLFEARVRAHKLFATFAEVVQNVAYPSDSEDDARARTALLGPYHRFLNASRGAATSEGDEAEPTSPDSGTQPTA